MEAETMRKAKEAAADCIVEVGRIIRARFDDGGSSEEKDEFGDVVTETDLLADRLLVEAIGAAFPDHRIHSEEAGDNGKNSDWLWLIDPLDGTNNYAIGLPVFAVSLTLLFNRRPVLAVIYEPITERLYIASEGGGAFCGDRRIRLEKKSDTRKKTIGWIQGHTVQHDERAVRLRSHLDRSFKRMMRLWAPTLQWCMLARGDIDGIVLFNSEGDDLYSGILMVKEAGGLVMDFEGNEFTEMCAEPYLIACRPEDRDYFLAVVSAGMALEIR